MNSPEPTENRPQWGLGAPRPAPSRKPLVIVAAFLLAGAIGYLNARTGFVGRLLGTAPRPPISVTPRLVGSGRNLFAALNAVDARGRALENPQQYVRGARVDIFGPGQRKLVTIRLEAT